METKSPAVFFLLLSLIIFFQNVRVQGQTQLEWTTTFQIEVHLDGSATWVIERKCPLASENDTSIYQYATPSRVDEFSDNTKARVNEASVITGRSMSATSFQIEVRIIKTWTGEVYGIVKYQFDWMGFAEIEDKQILIGDVFVGKFEDLYRDDALIIKYPSGYTLVAAYPVPDDIKESDRMLTWYGIKNFGAGEPKVILHERVVSILDIIQENAYSIVGILMFIGIGAAGFWFFKFRKKEKEEVLTKLLSLSGIEDEEEKVVALLRAAQGRLYQSAITKQCGFSKAKTSNLLAVMESKGKIRRQKKGREKVVTLIE